MKYAIIGSGEIGTALARVFARNKIEVAIANSRGPATQLGFAPVELGRLDQGGTPLHFVGGQPGGLLFQNLEKLG